VSKQIGVQAILFDLDGTLLDTAPDMVAALNMLRAEQTKTVMDYSLVRAHVSNGAVGLVGIGFPGASPERHEVLRRRFLELYAERLAEATVLFPGMDNVLQVLEAAGLPWGVVTNKPAYLTEPLLQRLGLTARCASVVSGDTLPQRKPHPLPLLHAAKTIGVDAAQAAYVGDAQRDIEAGRAAGMMTVAAVYGYLPPGDDPDSWGADHHIDDPANLLEILGDLGATEGRSKDATP
jgi:phosphoglycolate phosphatase